MKRAGLVQLQVLNYAELEISNPGIQHPQSKGAGAGGRCSTHLSQMFRHDTFSKSSGEVRGGTQKML